MQTPKPMTLSRNFSWTFLGNVVYAGCQWGMLIVLAKLGSPEMVGQFTLGLALTAPVLMFTNLNLRNLQATDAKESFRFIDYLGLRLISTGAALAVIVVIPFIAKYSWNTTCVIWLIGLAKALESISDIIYGLFQHHELMDRIAKAMILKGPLSLFLLGIGVYLSGNVIWGIVGLLTAWAIILLVYEVWSAIQILGQFALSQQGGNIPLVANLKKWAFPKWHWKTLFSLTYLALPLGFVMMLISLNANIPRYMIEQSIGTRELGIFSALSYLMVAGDLVLSALGQSASPRLAKYYVSGNRSGFCNLLLKLVGIGTLLGAIGIVLALVGGKALLTILYGSEYADHKDVFIFLMIAAGINYVARFLGSAMTASRYLNVQIPIFLSMTATSALACWYLIPIFGLKGAALALIFAAIVQVLITSGVIVHAVSKLQPYGSN